MDHKKFIDTESLIASKNPKLLKRLPGFVLRYLKRILHEKEVNEFISKNRNKKNEEFCDAVIEEFDIEIDVRHIERIPDNGKIVIAMNHPLGGMDAMILVSALKEKRTDLKFIVNDILMNLDNLKDLFVGVDKVRKTGENKQKSLRQQIESLFQSDNAICIFPAGMVSRRTDWKIQDYEWKKTFVTYAKRHGQDIVPVYINGKLSRFFYNLASFRKFLGIKANIEMLYLSNELFKQRKAKMTFVVGEVIKNEELFNSSNDREIAQEIRTKVYNLQKELK